MSNMHMNSKIVTYMYSFLKWHCTSNVVDISWQNSEQRKEILNIILEKEKVDLNLCILQNDWLIKLSCFAIIT